jgi:hypothetical protein
MENNEQPASQQGGPASPELTAQVQQLVNEAFTAGVDAAIARARASGNDALVDELHAALSRPDIRDELLKRGQLPKAA